MVMDMGRDAAAQDAVELVYEPTVQELAQALRARQRASRFGRMQRWLPGVLAVFVALDLASYLAGGHTSLGLLFWALFVAALLPAVPWLTARQLRRLTQRQGTFRAVVTDSGINLTTDTSTTTMTWAAMPRYAETRDVFVLLSGDKQAVGVTLLPKRGLQNPPDIDRLRQILETHLRRV